jgi:hypothetical protein
MSYLVRNVPMLTSLEMSPYVPGPNPSIPSPQWKGFGIAVGSVKVARRLCARRGEALTGPTAVQAMCGEGLEGPSGFKGGHF